MYDDLCKICGSDGHTGSFSKDFTHDFGDFSLHSDDVEMETNEEGANSEGPSLPSLNVPHANAPKAGQSSSSNVKKDKSGKSRLNTSTDILEGLIDRVGDIASSIRELKEDKLDKEALFQALLELQDELILTDSQISKIFDHLVKEKEVALAFLARPPRFRRVWLVDFVMQRIGDDPPPSSSTG
jgi:hypothetical protein